VEFKNTTRDDLDLPTLGLSVKAHGTVEVTGDDAKALARNPAFERVDEPQPRPGARSDNDGDDKDGE
jgi:hypothetical protein